VAKIKKNVIAKFIKAWSSVQVV